MLTGQLSPRPDWADWVRFSWAGSQWGEAGRASQGQGGREGGREPANTSHCSGLIISSKTNIHLPPSLPHTTLQWEFKINGKSWQLISADPAGPPGTWELWLTWSVVEGGAHEHWAPGDSPGKGGCYAHSDHAGHCCNLTLYWTRLASKELDIFYGWKLHGIALYVNVLPITISLWTFTLFTILYRGVISKSRINEERQNYNMIIII